MNKNVAEHKSQKKILTNIPLNRHVIHRPSFELYNNNNNKNYRPLLLYM